MMKKAILTLGAVASLTGAAISLTDGIKKYVRSGAYEAEKKRRHAKRAARKAARKATDNVVADVELEILEEYDLS